MSNQFLSLLAACALAVPVSAQGQALQPGNPDDKIATTYTGEILPGQEHAFMDMAKAIVADVEQEPGTLAYRWSMRADGKTFDVVEIYKDSNAIVAHVKAVGSKFGGDLGKTQKTLKFVVYGDPNAEARKAIDGLHPDYQKPFAGFIR
jgi:quinol monooxygenase YgiN